MERGLDTHIYSFVSSTTEFITHMHFSPCSVPFFRTHMHFSPCPQSRFSAASPRVLIRSSASTT